jgi:hypothetical protein
MRTTILALIAAAFLSALAGGICFASPDYAFPEEEYLDSPAIIVNRPVNVQGLTGLLLTNSAYTQPKGNVTIGLSSIAENSKDPDFSVIHGITSITVGVTDRFEVALRANAFGTNLGSTENRQFGFGDTDFLMKLRLTSQGDTLPAIALGFGVTAPTGDEVKGFRGVQHQGLRLMLIGSSETEMPDDIVLGVYFEGQIVYNDSLPWEDADSDSDRYGVLNAGLLLPLNANRNLQAIVEYSSVVKKNIPTIYEENHHAIMPALRFVTEKLNLSVGVQFYHRTDDAATNNRRYIGTLSYAF